MTVKPEVAEYEKIMLKEPDAVPDIQAGDTVRVHINFYESPKGVVAAGPKKIHRIAAKGKISRGEVKVERVQIFEGTVVAMKGSGSRKKLTVRKIASGVGVEKTWFIHSRKVSKIEITRRAKVRRAKLGFLRHRVGKATRLKERRV